ncbi:unnamed protein product [Absidia cylindrospora]
MSALLHLTLIFSLILVLVKAQVGPVISSPENNATVAAGKPLKIEYSYPNLGPGTYTVDVNLWKDASASEPMQNLVTGFSVPDGASNGTNLQFNTNATISVDMPSNLTDTFYLTLHQHVQIQSGNEPTVRSAPLMLHSAAMAHLPQSLSVLLVIALGAFGFSLVM